MTPTKNISKSNRKTHNTLLVIPLTVITVLCFGFVLAQPRLNSSDKASASGRNDDRGVKTLSPPAESSLPQLEQVPDSAGNAADSSQPAYNPQPASAPAASAAGNSDKPYATSDKPVDKPTLLDKVLPSGLR